MTLPASYNPTNTLNPGGSWGPFESSAGDIYFVIPEDDGAGGTTASVYKTSDPSSSFPGTEQDSSNRPTITAGASAVAQQGDDLCLICAPAGGYNLEAAVFDMSTDSWGSMETVANHRVFNDQYYFGEIVSRSDGTFVVAYDDYAGVMGTNYTRPMLAVRSTGGSWTDSIDLTDGDKSSSAWGLTALGVSTNDRVHVFTRDNTNSLLYGSTYLSNDTFGEVAVSTGYDRGIALSIVSFYGVGFTESSADKMRMPCYLASGNDMYVVEFTDQDTPVGSAALTWTALASATHYSPYGGSIVVDGNLRRYMILIDTFLDDVVYLETGDGNDTWGTYTSLWAASGPLSEVDLRGAGYLPSRSAIGVLWTNNGTTGDVYYDEISISSTHDSLTADDLQALAQVSTPALAQVHALLADDLEADAELSTPALSQTHALLADDLESASEVSSPSLAIIENLLADDLEAQAEVSTPALSQTHALAADDLEAQAELSTPVLAQLHSLAADDLEAQAEISTPSLTESNALLADDLEAASEISTPSISQVHALLADDLEAQAEVSSPALGQEHALLADDLEGQAEISTPSLAQVHALLADDLESAAELSTPTLTVNIGDHNLFADDLEALAQVSTPSLAQVHALLADDLDAAAEISTPSLAQVHALSASDLEAGAELSTPSLAENEVPVSEILVDTHDGRRRARRDEEDRAAREQEARADHERLRRIVRRAFNEAHGITEGGSDAEPGPVDSGVAPAAPVSVARTGAAVELASRRAAAAGLAARTAEIERMVGEMSAALEAKMIEEDALAILLLTI